MWLLTLSCFTGLALGETVTYLRSVSTVMSDDLQPESLIWDVDFGVLLSSYTNGTIFQAEEEDTDSDTFTVTPFFTSEYLSSTTGFRIYNERIYICNNFIDTVYAWMDGDQGYQGNQGQFIVGDLANGTVLEVIDLPNFSVDEEPFMWHFCNDIAVDEDGNAYISDSFAGAVYVYEKDSQEIDLFAYNDEWWAPQQFGLNGIALNDDETYLVVGVYYNPSLYTVDATYESGTTVNVTSGMQVQIENANSLLYFDGIQMTSNPTYGDIAYVVGAGQSSAVYMFTSENEFEEASLNYTYTSKYGTLTSVVIDDDTPYAINSYLYEAGVSEYQIEEVSTPEECAADDGNACSDSSDDSNKKHKVVEGIMGGVIGLLCIVILGMGVLIYRSRKQDSTHYQQL